MDGGFEAQDLVGLVILLGITAGAPSAIEAPKAVELGVGTEENRKDRAEAVMNLRLMT